MAVPPSAVASARRMRRFAKILGFAPVQSFLKARVEKNVKGPTRRSANASGRISGAASRRAAASSRGRSRRSKATR